MKLRSPDHISMVPTASRAGAFALLGAIAGTFLGTPASAQEWTSAQFSRQISSEESAEVTIRYSAGRIALSAGSANQLYALRLRYDANSQEPVHEFENGRLELGVEGIGRTGFFRSGATDGEMELTLTNRIPLDLTLDLGAVRADLDLGGLRLTSLSIHTGASDGDLRVSSPNSEEMESVELKVGAASFRARDLGNLNAAEISLEGGVGDFRLDLNGLRRAETRVDVKMGLGSLEIRIPREAGVRLERESFLTSLNAPGLDRRDGVYLSSNWDQAAIRVDISVNAALGSISIVRFDP
ncbi:MAG: LiaF domain-containing protein [Gemmatimonadota bacterium]